MRSFKTLHSAILTVLLTLSLCACSAQNSASKAEEAQAVSTQTKEAQTAGLPQDGTYEPASFTAEGGTGKVQITCPEITIENGAAQALIEFSSPHYDWVKVDGAQYDPENADKEDRENSVFRIPVRLDEKMTISGLTTAMSEPHEIEYTIFVSLTESGSAEAKTGSGTADTAIESGAAIHNEGTATVVANLANVSFTNNRAGVDVLLTDNGDGTYKSQRKSWRSSKWPGGRPAGRPPRMPARTLRPLNCRA